MSETASHGADLLLQVFLMFAAAKLMAEVFTRLRQPAVIGEILAGVLIGPSVLGWVAPSHVSHLLSEIGVILLLFSVGLETKPASILNVGGTAAAVAVLGIVAPFAAGWGIMRALGDPNIESLFVGTAMVATSVGITARVLGELGVMSQQSARIILGAAVIDDILGLLLLAGVSSLSQGEINVAGLATTAVMALGFVAVVAIFGSRLITRSRHRIERLHSHNSTFVFAMALCFGLALAAEHIGVAAIIGGFLAGMALAEAVEGNHAVHEQTRGVTELMVPFFLVSIGMQLKLDVFAKPETIELALGLTAAAVLTKLVGCGLGAMRLGWRGALQVGAGMVPRGEVGIVVAQIGLAGGIISESLFGVVLFMAVATTLLAPPMIRPLYAGTRVNDEAKP